MKQNQEIPSYKTPERIIVTYVANRLLLECVRILNLLVKENQSNKTKADEEADEKNEQRGDMFFRDCVAYALYQFSQSDSIHKIGSPEKMIDLVNGISRYKIDHNAFENAKNNTPSIEKDMLWSITAYVLKRCFSSEGMSDREIVEEATTISGYKKRKDPSNASRHSKIIEKQYKNNIIPHS